MRVLTPPDTYTAFPGSEDQFTTHDAGPLGILGGADDPDVTTDDFNMDLFLYEGRLIGVTNGLVESRENCPDGPESCQTVTGSTSIALNLPDEFPEGTATRSASALSPTEGMGRAGVTTNLIGTAVIKPGFCGYQLIPGHYSEGFKIIDQARADAAVRRRGV